MRRFAKWLSGDDLPRFDNAEFVSPRNQVPTTASSSGSLTVSEIERVPPVAVPIPRAT